jgi:hypothetical protein
LNFAPVVFGASNLVQPTGNNFCPLCGARIELDDINVSEGAALCRACGQLSRLSDVVSTSRPASEILQQPPRGCSVEEWGNEIIVRASLRSFATFCGALFAALFWNGIVSVFLLLVFASLYNQFIGPLPAWFPAPDMKDPMPLGLALFLCVFLTPFVAIGCLLLGAVVMTLGGRVEARVGDTQASVATGIGPVVWRQRFDPSRVRIVKIGLTAWKTNDQSSPLIQIDADRSIKFGSMLSDERRQWMRVVLQQLLSKRTPSERLEVLSHIRQSSSAVFDPRRP